MTSSSSHRILRDNASSSVWHAAYNSKVSGTISVHVLVDQSEIYGSPFPVVVSPGPPHPQFCAASGSGLNKATAGKEAEFVVLLKTKNGEAVDLDWGQEMQLSAQVLNQVEQTLLMRQQVINCTMSREALGTYRLTYALNLFQCLFVLLTICKSSESLEGPAIK